MRHGRRERRTRREKEVWIEGEEKEAMYEKERNRERELKNNIWF